MGRRSFESQRRIIRCGTGGANPEGGYDRGYLEGVPRRQAHARACAAIKEHKADIIQIIREDELMRHTGVIQSERQVFEMSREYFGLNNPEGIA
jgi:hypothetical protein